MRSNNYKNEKITQKFDHCVRLLKKERLLNQFLTEQIKSFKDKKIYKQILHEIEELSAKKTSEEAAAAETKRNNDLIDLTITEVHSEFQSEVEFSSDLKDLLNDDGDDVKPGDDIDNPLQVEVITLHESETEIRSGSNYTEILLEEHEPLQNDQDDNLDTLIQDTFENIETVINKTGDADDEMDSTDITEKNTSAEESSIEELLGEDTDTGNKSETSSDDVPIVQSKSGGRKRNRVGQIRKRRQACGHCGPCSMDDCGVCSNCEDKPKFGGLGKKKQKCILKKCENPLR